MVGCANCRQMFASGTTCPNCGSALAEVHATADAPRAPEQAGGSARIPAPTATPGYNIRPQGAGPHGSGHSRPATSGPGYNIAPENPFSPGASLAGTAASPRAASVGPAGANPGLSTGLAAMAAVVVVWVGLSSLSNGRWGILAVVTGLVIGIAVDRVGRWRGITYGVAAGLMSLLGSFIATLISGILIQAHDTGASFLDTVSQTATGDLLHFGFLDFVFWAAGAGIAFYFCWSR